MPQSLRVLVGGAVMINLTFNVHKIHTEVLAKGYFEGRWSL